MTLSQEEAYVILRHPEVPSGWLFCGACGDPMHWALVPSASFNRKTGKRNDTWMYQCSRIRGIIQLDGYDHDRVRDGDSYARYLNEIGGGE